MDDTKPNPQDPDDVDPAAHLKHVKPQPQPVDIANLDIPTLLKTTRVLFYPACEFDWRPLVRFTLPGQFDCQTILYCDWASDREAEFEAHVKNLPVNIVCESMRNIEPKELTPASAAAPFDFLLEEELARYRDCHRQFAVQEGWGRRAVMRGELGDGQVRKLNLIYLGAEGVATYLQVFNQQQIAPFMLCTMNCGAGFGFNWTDFRFYAKALGRAVESNPSKPMYVINEGGQPYDWPWNEEVYAVDGMRVFKRPDAVGGKPVQPVPSHPPKFPNPFRRRSKPGTDPGPMPKPKTGPYFPGIDEIK